MAAVLLPAGVHLGEQVAGLGSVPDEGALLVQRNEMPSGHVEREPRPVRHARAAQMNANPRDRSEERRVGKTCVSTVRTRRATVHYKKNMYEQRIDTNNNINLTNK